MLKRRNKVVFVVSHNAAYLKDADEVIVLDKNGKIAKRGNLLMKCYISNII